MADPTPSQSPAQTPPPPPAQQAPGAGGREDMLACVAALEAALLPCLPARELQAVDRSLQSSHQIDVERHARDFMEAAKKLQSYFISLQREDQPTAEEMLRKIHSESASSTALHSSGLRMRWENEHRWALLEEARRVIDAGQFGTIIERNRQIADRLSQRFPQVNPRFSDETVRTQLRTLGRQWRAGTVLETYSGNEVVACSTDLVHTLFPETTSASEDTQSVPGGSMTVTCNTRCIRKTARLVESLPGLTAPQKARAALILKDKDNLTWFLSWEDPEVRLEWIKEKLGLGGTEPGSSSAGAQTGGAS